MHADRGDLRPYHRLSSFRPYRHVLRRICFDQTSQGNGRAFAVSTSSKAEAEAVRKMMHSTSTPPLGSEFDAFLFAPVDNDRNGMQLSVPSAFALGHGAWRDHERGQADIACCCRAPVAKTRAGASTNTAKPGEGDGSAGSACHGGTAQPSSKVSRRRRLIWSRHKRVAPKVANQERSARIQTPALAGTANAYGVSHVVEGISDQWLRH